MLRNFFAREEQTSWMEGQTLVEYALIIVLVSVALIAALGFLADDIEAAYNNIGNTLNP